MRSVVVLSALAALACLSVRAEDPPRDKDKEAPNALREQYLEAAKKYEFFLDKEQKKPLKFEEKPVFSWSNDDRWSGDVFVWTAKGRPQVIGCILSGPGKQTRPAFHEFHSLAPDPLGSAQMTGKYQWAPAKGIEFKKFGGEPAATAAARLAQMRAISREFKVFMQADGEWELRLLPQPIYRYQPAEGPVIDGALFTWVWTKGTDPELIVAVECHRTDKGREWRFAPIQFTNREVWIKHDDKEIWRIAAHREGSGDPHTGVYTTRYAGEIAQPKDKP
jgi:hypothetical protein